MENKKIKNMKKLTILFFVVLLIIVSFDSCNKDEQPRYIKVDILTRTGAKIVAMEKYIDDNRATANPNTYDSLAARCTNEVMNVLLQELKPDTFRSNSGDIALVVSAYDKCWREKHPKKKSRVWSKLDVGVSVDVYRVCTAYSEKLLKRLKGYCEGIINGGIDWVPGDRCDWMEIEIQQTFIYDPQEDVSMFWQYRDRLNDYFKKFAENPNNKAKPKRDGFLNFGWWQ